MKNLGSVYMVGEICILVSMVLYHKLNDLENSIFLTFPGRLVMGYAFVGIIFIILLAIFRSQRRIGSRRFYGQITLLVLGIVIPFIVLFFIISQLH